MDETTELDEDKRPYAPAVNVLAVIERTRRLNLPPVINNDFMRLADVPEGSLGRVAFALRFLGLTDGNARPTDVLRTMARAPDEEYRDLLASVVRSAYQADFERVNPAEEPQSKIVSAFQRYEPRSQTTRMVMLFLGLAKAAGIPVLEAPRDRPMQTAKVPTRTKGPRQTVRPTSIGSLTNAVPTPTLRGQPAADPNLLFGVTVEDIGALPQKDFDDVWNALGKIARARAASLRAAEQMADQARARAESEEEAAAETD